MDKIAKEKVLSQIVLKYYKTPKKSWRDKPSGITCSFCFKKNIVNVGGGFCDAHGKIHQICEECAVKRYREEEKFKSLTAARARRRRIFDIGYLFNEMIIDKYLEMKGLKDYKELDGDMGNDIFIKSGDLFNQLFSKEEKIRMEEIENQKDIEMELHKVIEGFDFGRFFRREELLFK